jgi:CubicO group peptidase (beta-lactamase class C family)
VRHLPDWVRNDRAWLGALRPHTFRRRGVWTSALRGRALAVGAAFTFSLVTSIGPLDSTPQAVAANPAATVIAKYRASIPQLMREQGVPGLAVVLVDANRTLWIEGFGHLDGRGSAPATDDTTFSVQSMSKLFTATAVMQAVAAGRLDLDAPITTYLPEFTVHSAFESHPERKITLRMLLSHTAGFTHEAPLGNNNDLDSGSFDAHVRSISDTWLRFPVGSGYAYSNLGIDLAACILERVEEKPFAEVMRDSLLEQLGMDHSTFDRAVINANANRAIGHVHPYPKPPVDVPMTGAGGLYTSAADLARFLHFELNGGSIDGRIVLGPRWLNEMETVQAPRAGAPAGYALGVVRHRWNRWAQTPDLFEHGGGGFGFLTDMWWAPQLGIGVAVLTNSQDHQLQNALSISILTDVVSELAMYRGRLAALPSRLGAEDPPLSFNPPAGMANLVAKAAMVPTADEATRWASYAGAYRLPAWGYIGPKGAPARFLIQAGVPYFEIKDETTSVVRHRLAEIEPGLFLADNGETLDFRGPVTRWRNFELVRVTGGPSTVQWAILWTASLVAFGWLVVALVRSVRRSSSRSSPRLRRLPALVACATALLMLATVGLLVWMPGLVDSGFLGRLDLSLAQRLAVDLPVAVAVLGSSMTVLAAWGWIGRWWSRPVTLQYAALAVAAVALVSLLAGWHLIGLSMS